MCGQSGLPDPANDTAFNDLASFPTFNPDYFGLDFDPNNTDYDWSDFQRPAAAENMTRAETERKLRVVGGVQAQPGEIRSLVQGTLYGMAPMSNLPALSGGRWG